MYEARQNKEKVSRRIDGGGMIRQRMSHTIQSRKINPEKITFDDSAFKHIKSGIATNSDFDIPTICVLKRRKFINKDVLCVNNSASMNTTAIKNYIKNTDYIKPDNGPYKDKYQYLLTNKVTMGGNWDFSQEIYHINHLGPNGEAVRNHLNSLRRKYRR